MKKLLLILALAIVAITAINMATAQTYDPYAVQVINNLIANNGLNATPNAPETWLFAAWNDETPKQITLLLLSETKLTGNVLCSGLTKLQKLWVEKTSITKLNVSGCMQLKELWCRENKLTELNLTDCFELKELYCSDNCFTQLDVSNCIKLKFLVCNSNYLTEIDISKCTQLEALSVDYNYFTKFEARNRDILPMISCEGNRLIEVDVTDSYYPYGVEFFWGYNQNVSLSLFENELGEYILPVSLNKPTFQNSAITYSNDTLKSTDNTVSKTDFIIKVIGHDYFKLVGIMNFSYIPLEIKTPEKIKPNVYPNPVKDIFFIECETFNRVIIYDTLGKAVLNQSATSKTEINVSHLPKGVYIVDAFLDYKNIGAAKIVKQ